MRLRSMAATLACLVCLLHTPAFAQPAKVTTDGTNRQSPVKVVSVTLTDSTPDSFYLSGNTGGSQSEVRVSTAIKNTSGQNLSNITIKVTIYDLTDKKLAEYTKNLAMLTADEVYEYHSPTFENTSLALVQARVTVTHDKQVLATQENQGEGTNPPPVYDRGGKDAPKYDTPKYPDDKDAPPGY